MSLYFDYIYNKKYSVKINNKRKINNIYKNKRFN